MMYCVDVALLWCGVVGLSFFCSVFDCAFLCVVGWLLACLCVGGAVLLC